MKNNIKLKSSTSLNKFRDKIICSVCQKEFELKEKYIIADGCACSWKCFLKEAKRQEAEKEAEKIAREKGKNNKQNKK